MDDCKFKETSEIYNMFGDDYSRQIYAQRVLYSLTNDEKYIRNMICDTFPGQWLESELAKKNKGNVLLYGAGIRGKSILKVYGKYFSAIIDNDPKKSNEIIDGLKVMPLCEAIAAYREPVVVVSMKGDVSCIIDDLVEKGIKAENILNMGQKITDLRDGQYFDLPYLKPMNNEVFVDCGAFDGDSVRNFKKWCENKYSHVYGFEPDEYNSSLLKQNLSKDIKANKCSVFQKGTWSSNTILEFSNNSDEASHICEGGSEKIEVCSIDEELLGKNNEKVTFIKMDIEGAELETLKGAKRIISEQKPKLAISIYHKKEDIFTIPAYVKELNPGYRFYLRHYTFAAWDTVFYAIP